MFALDQEPVRSAGSTKTGGGNVDAMVKGYEAKSASALGNTSGGMNKHLDGEPARAPANKASNANVIILTAEQKKSVGGGQGGIAQVGKSGEGGGVGGDTNLSQWDDVLTLPGKGLKKFKNNNDYARLEVANESIDCVTAHFSIPGWGDIVDAEVTLLDRCTHTRPLKAQAGARVRVAGDASPFVNGRIGTVERKASKPGSHTVLLDGDTKPTVICETKLRNSDQSGFVTYELQTEDWLQKTHYEEKSLKPLTGEAGEDQEEPDGDLETVVEEVEKIVVVEELWYGPPPPTEQSQLYMPTSEASEKEASVFPSLPRRACTYREHVHVEDGTEHKINCGDSLYNTFNEKQSCLSKLAVLAFDYGALDPKKSIGHVTKAVIIVADDKTDIDDKTDALTDWNEQPLINYRTDDPSSRKHWLKDGACRALIFKDKHGKSGYEMDDWEPVQDVPAIAWTLSDPDDLDNNALLAEADAECTSLADTISKARDGLEKECKEVAILIRVEFDEHAPTYDELDEKLKPLLASLVGLITEEHALAGENIQPPLKDVKVASLVLQVHVPEKETPASQVGHDLTLRTAVAVFGSSDKLLNGCTGITVQKQDKGSVSVLFDDEKEERPIRVANLRSATLVVRLPTPTHTLLRLRTACVACHCVPGLMRVLLWGARTCAYCAPVLPPSSFRCCAHVVGCGPYGACCAGKSRCLVGTPNVRQSLAINRHPVCCGRLWSTLQRTL